MSVTPAGRGLGCVRQLPDIRDARLTMPPTIVLPPAVDLRPRFFPVEDQGQLGSCTAFASGAAFRWARRVRYGWTDHAAHSAHYPQGEDYQISHLFEYYNARALEGSTASDAGASIRDAIKVLARFGACAFHNWPYDIAKFALRPPDAAYTNASHHEAVKYAAVAQDDTQLKSVLASGFPVVIGIAVYASFESQQADTTGIIPMPAQGESMLGGHAVCLVGYQGGEYIFRNSWGASWGDHGYGYLPAAYVLNPQLAFDFWQIDVVADNVPKPSGALPAGLLGGGGA